MMRIASARLTVPSQFESPASLVFTGGLVVVVVVVVLEVVVLEVVVVLDVVVVEVVVLEVVVVLEPPTPWRTTFSILTAFP